MPIRVDEFSTLNRCLDNAIAVAVAAFSKQQEAAEQVAVAALDAAECHKLKNCLATASYAARALEIGNLPMSGATGTIL